MTQVTIQLNDETEKSEHLGQEQKVSKSKWIAMIIREKAKNKWPEEFVQLAGTWQDIPTLEEIRAGTGEDAPRESI